MDSRERHRRAGAIAVVIAVALAIAWFFMRARPRGPLGDLDPTGASARDRADSEEPAPREPSPPGTSRPDGAVSARARLAPAERTVRDPGLHDDVRARIFAAWREGLAAAPRGAPIDASIAGPPAPGHLDPEYIRSLVRDEFVPMARVCYDQQLERTPDAGGRVTLAFTILADEQAGGIVDDVTLDDRDAGTDVWDETFRTCMRETMHAMVFRAPTGGGRVTVRYPFVLQPGERDR
ncbi:MAG: AgmX/PglI C-terminal domain-containing protein [Deltaproteobacteria bacterium]